MLKMVFALVLALCPVASADAGTDFTRALDAQGVRYRDQSGAVLAALTVCDLMASGASSMDAVLAVQYANPGMPLQSAARFALVAAQYYCPQFA